MIDLHAHSNYSDGLYEPAQVVENVVRDGLSAVALCDHDCTWGLAEARQRAKELNIDFIPGVELTVSVEGHKDHADEIHMLGLFVKPTDHLEDIHARIKKAKDAYSFTLAEAMRKHCALPVYVENMRQKFHGAISMGAFGEYMLQEGMIQKFSDRKKMTKQLVAEGKMVRKPEFGISVEEAIEAIHEAGGLAILAHPYRMKLSDNVLFEGIKEMKAKGLDGVEAHYTNYGEDTMEQIKKTLRMAVALDLLVSGGSDYHKDKPTGRFQGHEGVPAGFLTVLKKAHLVRS